MSFHVEFVATKADAVKCIAQDYLPDEVRLFLRQALSAFGDSALVSVKAIGHLYNKDYDCSTATISVHQILVRGPKVPA